MYKISVVYVEHLSFFLFCGLSLCPSQACEFKAWLCCSLLRTTALLSSIYSVVQHKLNVLKCWGPSSKSAVSLPCYKILTAGCKYFVFHSSSSPTLHHTWNRSSWESMMQLIHRPSQGRNGFLCLWAESDLKLLPGWALLSVGPALSWESVSWFTPIPPRCLRTKAPNGAPPHPLRIFCVRFSVTPSFSTLRFFFWGVNLPGISVSLLLSPLYVDLCA